MSVYVREFIRAVICGVLVFLGMLLFSYALGSHVYWNGRLAEEFLRTVVYTTTIYYANFLIFILLDRIFAQNRFQAKRIIIGFLCSAVATIVILFTVHFIEEVLLKQKDAAEFLKNETPSAYAGSIVVFLIITLFVHAFYFYKKLQENKVKEQKIIATTASAQFESLKNQIDPHFLFNSLNVLTSLIEENPDMAQKFTTSLSKIYRYVLEQKDKELVEVKEELNFAKTYMNLLKMRFEESVFYELPEKLSNPEAKVVPLSLQLLLENTVKHNTATSSRPLHIRIFEQDNYLVVRNDYQKKEVLQDRKGVGLQNIVNRYGIITSRKVKIEQDAQYFTVYLPLLTKQLSIMEPDAIDLEDSYEKALKKVEDIKGFYGNLVSYIVIITGLFLLNLQTSPEYFWFLFPALGWGFGLLIHGLSVFGHSLRFLGKDWEEKKIRELMKKEEQQKWD
ncbi:2TM domain-containing protein [Flavobacterium kingsejongi]|uniref:Histidine kinase n=1 Tax=Flavobacterium kingsejongi TaxID=1678728 RepID=A0A2S1LQC1_9FLAO|nr:2TM domain-containing protein [Flavobacterium kingsejongi]AWG25919.1 histidine kinase [Flavobacterium kingsejongi]